MAVQTEATKAYRAVRRQAEKIKSDEHQVVGTMSVGDAFRQGDLYIVCLDAVPRGAELVKKPSPQLAPGNTQGSRHCLESLSGVEVYRAKDANPLVGPIVKSSEPIRVNHPEHGDVTIPPGTYQIRYQRAFADELRRVQD